MKIFYQTDSQVVASGRNAPRPAVKGMRVGAMHPGLQSRGCEWEQCTQACIQWNVSGRNAPKPAVKGMRVGVMHPGLQSRRCEWAQCNQAYSQGVASRRNAPRPAVKGLQVGAMHPGLHSRGCEWAQCTQACIQGVASGRNAPTTNLDTPTKSLQNIKDQPADQPLKNCDTLPQAGFPFVELPCLETTHFPTLMYILHTSSTIIKRIM